MFITIIIAITLVTFADEFLVAAHSKSETKNRNPNVIDSNVDVEPIHTQDGAFIEIAGHTIGDEHRSEVSSKHFFNTIDKNRDGKLGQAELSQFLMNHIGGLTLDTADEATIEARAILSRLDHNRDNSLDSKDVFRYWTSLESLLTVDEVAEWVVHSVQLPIEIGEIFRQNHVTGYDFPELVENDGQALLDELKIEKPTFRKKIVRLVNALMLGIGSRPKVPSGIQLSLEGCSTAILKWKRPDAKGFPVHKFRVQRRRLSISKDKLIIKNNQGIPTTDVSSNESICVKSDKNDHNISEKNGNIHNNFDKRLVYDFKHSHKNENQFCSSDISRSKDIDGDKVSSQHNQRNILEWQTIYDNGLAEFHDFGLERGQKGYQYRIQAWNAVGKSDWALVEIKQWERKKCDRILDELDVKTTHTSSFIIWLRFFWRVIHSFSNVIMGLLGLCVTVFKLKRATMTSTTSGIDPVFKWLLNGINILVKLIIGVDIIPSSFSILDTSTSNNNDYDRTVNLVGLNGYEKCNSNRLLQSSQISTKLSAKSHTSQERRGQRQIDPTRKKMKIKDDKFVNPFLRKKSTNNMEKNSHDQQEAYITRDVSAITTLSEESDEHLDLSCLPSKDRKSMSRSVSFERDISVLDMNSPSVTTSSNVDYSSFDGENENHCIICKKRYKFGKRKKHHCSICHETFCHKHGKTTHSNLVPCKVPGTCVCNDCLVVD